MSKSNVAIGLLVAAVLVVGFAVSRSDIGGTSAAVQDAAGNQAIVVTYTDKGFSPSVVKVARGTSVTFLNMSNKALRVAPLEEAKDANSGSLGFAASKTIGKNSAFGISLSVPGLVAYKNQLDPTTVGVVVVE